MTLRLMKLQKRLCNALQNGLPICERPFAKIAKDLDCSEKKVLEQTHKLRNAGIIRRIGAILNYRALGIKSTLVAAHVPQKNLQKVIKTVNSLKGVSHNYLRSHYYNLWFTLQAQTAKQIDTILMGLSSRFGIDFHSMPVVRSFKLDVRFDAESGSEKLLGDAEQIQKGRIVDLDGNQKMMLSRLQRDLDITATPFAFLCNDALGIGDVVGIITELVNKGVIRRIAAVLDYRKLGFVANALFAAQVPQRRVVAVGTSLAYLPIVSHCYQRKTFAGWPYNLFAMIHGKNMNQIQRLINDFTKDEGIDSFQLLPTLSELKKQPIKHRF